MPVVASQPPSLATSFNDNPINTMAPAPEGHGLVRRDSRPVEFHTAIPEEDESVGTASEPAEPLTPSSDTAPAFAHPARQDTPVMLDSEKQMGAKPAPQPAAPAPATEERPAPVTRVKSNKMSVPADEKHHHMGMGKRVGSFVRSKLHRTSSHKDPPAPAQAQAPAPSPPVMPTEKVIVKTGVDGPSEVSTPAVTIPKYRRLSSFSLSARSTPKSSQGNSPPSPGSPTSTLSDKGENGEASQDKTKISKRNSTSATGLSSMKSPGITWANGHKDTKRPSRFRRRSASAESIPKMASNDGTVGLATAFSKPAAEGVGLKARRLSVSLPDEFCVDSCDLDKEFKSSSLMPGKRGKCLGRGATAEVRIMARKGASGSEELVAVKEFRSREKDEQEEEYIKKIKSEYSIAKSLHHPNIVQTVRLCENRGRWNHVMEFCNHGELFSLVERKLFSGGDGGHYSVNDRLCFFKQLLRGVGYLHAHGIAHRDIKLENLLLDKEGHLKISDFGVAEVFSGEHPGLRAAGGECGKNMGELRLSNPGICGSLPYIAPEVLEKKSKYDPRPLDIWSCAIVFLTMTFGGSPWQAAKPEYEYYRVFKQGWDEWLKDHPDGQITDAADGHPKCGKLFSLINPPTIKRLVLKMLHPIPEKRITIKEIMASPCVKNIDCCCPETFEDPNCCIDASKAPSKDAYKLTKTKQYLHHHIPPAPERKFAKVLTHRFDMGDGW